MEQKTNKTDHVLNLLSGTKKKEKSKASANSIKETKEQKIEEVSQLIKMELEKELEEKMITDLSSEQTGTIKKEVEEIKDTVLEQEPILEEQEEIQQCTEPKEEYEFLNVMEYVVSTQVKEYMKKFDTCFCSRCQADIIAYTLTQLPAKYVVINKEEKIPLLSFYEKKYDSQVKVELIKACMLIKENPHH